MLISRLTYILAIIIFAGLEALNIFVWPNPLFGLILLIAGISFFGLVIGSRLLKQWTRAEQVLWGALISWSLIGIFLTVCYYLWNLGPLALWLAWLPLAIIGFFCAPTPVYVKQKKEKNPRTTRFLLIALYAILGIIFYFAFALLWDSSTQEAIRSPWIVVPKTFFLLAFTLIAGSIAWSVKSKSQKLSWLLFSGITFLFLSVALFVYKIGYGFDPFIHQATERYLASHGTIIPKPFYYIGQYSWITFCNYFSHLGINMLDKILLPAMAASFLPAAIYAGIRRGFGMPEKIAKFGILAFLAVPFASLIATTPQGLANILALIIIFLSISYLKKQYPPLLFFYVLGAMCLAIHPLSGIPIAIYLVLLTIFKIKNRSIRIAATTIASLFGAVALPLVFIFNSLISGSGINVTSSILQSPKILFSNLKLPSIFVDSHFSSIIDFVYIYGNNLVWLIPLIAIISIIFIARKISAKLWIPGLMFLILLVNYFFLQNAVEFSFLISYEKGAYADRVISLAQFFLYPFFILGILWWIKKTWNGTWSWRILISLLIGGLATASLYLSYPRHDALEISKGINVSQTDIAAVQWVERDAHDDNFIVLANQTVSAAALHEFGFKKYFNEKFYYPIPTGGELYDYYLKMSYEAPSALTMRQAMDLVGVNYGYLIINDYWWNAEKIIEDAKLQTGTWQEIDDGKIYIFKYTK